jgi:hypothetical protein
MPVFGLQAQAKEEREPLPGAYTVLCRIVYLNLSVRLKNRRFSFPFFAVKTAGFSAFFPCFFPTASRRYTDNAHREIPKLVQNTVFSSCYTASLYGKSTAITCIDAVEKPAVLSAKMKNNYVFSFTGRLGTERKRIDIPIYSMITFRGDFPHAGGGCAVDNTRIFISVSSPFFQNQIKYFS